MTNTEIKLITQALANMIEYNPSCHKDNEILKGEKLGLEKAIVFIERLKGNNED